MLIVCGLRFFMSWDILKHSKKELFVELEDKCSHKSPEEQEAD